MGLKFSVSTVAMPLVGAGGVARVFLRGQRRIVADLFLGFGLLFVGIDFMQSAMSDVAANIDLGRWASPGPLAGLVLVLVGVVLTALMQSSSAAMAATLAALAGGAIDVRMGAYLVVGQNIGTTVTAVLGAMGGSAEAKQTAGAHMAFNLGTGIVALSLLPVLLDATTRIAGDQPALALAMFHTAFNLLGAVVFLPLTVPLAALLQRTIKSKVDPMTASLDRSSLRTVTSSQEAVRLTLAGLIRQQMRLVAARLSSKGPGGAHVDHVARVAAALDTTEEYVEDARSGGWPAEQVGAALQAMDHLRNITADLAESAPFERFHLPGPAKDFLDEFRAIEASIPAVLAGDVAADDVVAALKGLGPRRKRLRAKIIGASHQLDSGVLTARQDLEAIHWLDRIAWHLRHALRAWATMQDVPPATPGPGAE